MNEIKYTIIDIGCKKRVGTISLSMIEYNTMLKKTLKNYGDHCTEYLEVPYNDEKHLWFNFDNGYQVSVVRSVFSYGSKENLWELAVLSYDKEVGRFVVDDNIICGYNGALGFLSDIDIDDILYIVKTYREKGG